jgi:hypothetical protein
VAAAAPSSRVERPAATAVLVGIAALAPIAVDVFLPSMPAMAREFDTSTGTLSLAVTLFIVAFAGAQLFLAGSPSSSPAASSASPPAASPSCSPAASCRASAAAPAPPSPTPSSSIPTAANAPSASSP